MLAVGEGTDGSKGADPSLPVGKTDRKGSALGAKPTIITPLKKVEATEGDEVLLPITCGPEAVVTVEWFKDNELVRDQPRFSQSSEGQLHSLKVCPIKWDDEGIYKCVLFNKHGLASCSAEVLVEGLYTMFWCGVVWCGVMWCGVVRCGVV